MNINMYAQGGSSLPAYVDYKPLINSSEDVSPLMATPDATTSSKSSGSSSDLTDKDTLAMLKTELDGLPNDVRAVTDMLSQFYIDQKLGIGGTASVETRYLKALSLAKTAKFNK